MDVQQQVKPKNLLSGVDLWGRNCVNPAARGALRLGLGLLMTNKVRGRVAEVGDALIGIPPLSFQESYCDSHSTHKLSTSCHLSFSPHTLCRMLSRYRRLKF